MTMSSAEAKKMVKTESASEKVMEGKMETKEVKKY